MVKRELLKIKIPSCEFEGMFESEVVKFGTGAMIKCMKKHTGKEVIVLVKK